MDGAKLKEFQDKFTQLFIEINSINGSVNLFKNLIKEVTDKYQDIDDLKPLNDKFDLCVKTYENACECLKVQKDALRDDISVCRTNINNIHDSLADISIAIQEHASSLESYKKCQESKMQCMQEGYSASMELLRKEIKSSLSKLQNELTVSPSFVFQQNNDIIRKLESASLDGTNSMLKVNNMDMTIRIIEKKIENLSILIKKIELSQAQ